MPGAKPLVSKRLKDFLESEDETISLPRLDEFDRFIFLNELTVNKLAFFRDMDMMLIILSNRMVINRQLSAYRFLDKATDDQLQEYTISATGVHWPQLDADLSLRGFLIEEALGRFSQNQPRTQAA
ncbi:MAG: DUF2442 domain-containing protein [Cytophagales bacterium]|nr:MAG: DUF2442 domain-containing protein [Cytophagales bacterium]